MKSGDPHCCSALCILHWWSLEHLRSLSHTNTHTRRRYICKCRKCASSRLHLNDCKLNLWSLTTGCFRFAGSFYAWFCTMLSPGKTSSITCKWIVSHSSHLLRMSGCTHWRRWGPAQPESPNPGNTPACHTAGFNTESQMSQTKQNINKNMQFYHLSYFKCQ